MTESEALKQIRKLFELAAQECPDKGVLNALLSDVLWVIKNTERGDDPS